MKNSKLLYLVLLISFITNLFLAYSYWNKLDRNKGVIDYEKELMVEDLKDLSKLIFTLRLTHSEMLSMLENNNIRYLGEIKKDKKYYFIELNCVLFDFDSTGIINKINVLGDTISR